VRTVLDTWYLNTDPETGDPIFHGILVDITARKNLETQLVEQSIRDPLTGCYNRRYLATMFAAERSADDRWGCIYVDIDHFKQYNDTHGHAAGDSILIRMSRFLMRHVRAEEPVVRMGGDEFLITLSETDMSSTEAIAHRLEKAGVERGPVSFSLGWATREGGESFEETVNRADRQLIQVRVVRRPERYPRRSPPEKD
jgi:diguanylate cyclase (GGDEF)-like protein